MADTSTAVFGQYVHFGYPNYPYHDPILVKYVMRCKWGIRCRGRAMGNCRFYHDGDVGKCPKPCYDWVTCDRKKCLFLHHRDCCDVMCNKSLEDPDPDDLDKCIEAFMRQDPVLSKQIGD